VCVCGSLGSLVLIVSKAKLTHVNPLLRESHEVLLGWAPTGTQTMQNPIISA